MAFVYLCLILSALATAVGIWAWYDFAHGGLTDD